MRDIGQMANDKQLRAKVAVGRLTAEVLEQAAFKMERASINIVEIFPDVEDRRAFMREVVEFNDEAFNPQDAYPTVDMETLMLYLAAQIRETIERALSAAEASS